MAALDEFNRADSATLGANWTEDPFLTHVSGSGLSIVSNQAAPDLNSAWNLAYWSAESYSGDMESVVTVGQKPGDNSFFRIFTRCRNPTTTGVTGYILLVTARPGASDSWKLVRADSNIQRVLISPATDPLREFSPGDKLRLTSIGDQHRGAINDGSGWVDVVFATDVTYTGAGTCFIGWGVDGGPGNTAARAESFSGGAIANAGQRFGTATLMGVGR